MRAIYEDWTARAVQADVMRLRHALRRQRMSDPLQQILGSEEAVGLSSNLSPEQEAEVRAAKCLMMFLSPNLPQVEREIQEVTPAIQARRRGDCQRHQIALISQEVASVLRPEQAKQVIAFAEVISAAQGARWTRTPWHWPSERLRCSWRSAHNWHKTRSQFLSLNLTRTQGALDEEQRLAHARGCCQRCGWQKCCGCGRHAHYAAVFGGRRPARATSGGALRAIESTGLQEADPKCIAGGVCGSPIGQRTSCYHLIDPDRHMCFFAVLGGTMRS